MSEHKTRRRWIKLWTQETLYGTTLNELLPDERAVWLELLCLAGDSIVPGYVCITENMPYTEEQLASILKVSKTLLCKSLQKLKSHEKIKQNGTGIIEITNWEKYQSDERTEYMRTYMRKYRKDKKQE